MEAKNISLDRHFPKDLSAVDPPTFNLIVNMSGIKLPARVPIEVRDWKVDDPIGRDEVVYERVRDQIEDLVMRLIIELRQQAKQVSDGVNGIPKPRPRSSGTK